MEAIRFCTDFLEEKYKIYTNNFMLRKVFLGCYIVLNLSGVISIGKFECMLLNLTDAEKGN